MGWRFLARWPCKYVLYAGKQTNERTRKSHARRNIQRQSERESYKQGERIFRLIAIERRTAMTLLRKVGGGLFLSARGVAYVVCLCCTLAMRHPF